MLALLREVLSAAPGARGGAITVALAPVDPRNARSFAAHQAFSEDSLRCDVLADLLPKARVTLAVRKTDLPHHRRLEIGLGDERRVLILLDQGLGGWRTPSIVKHDFNASARLQARAIAAMQTELLAETARGYPATIQVSL
jgi:hypothetical protein